MLFLESMRRTNSYAFSVLHLILCLFALESDAQYVAPAATNNTLKLVLFPEELAKQRGAQCLDGSPAGYYIRPGDPSNWVIFLEGGGLCITPVDCIDRSTSRLGTSTVWPEEHGPYMTTTTSVLNPFASYTQVFVPYCSGDTWLGNHARPHMALLGLQMSGHLILDTLVDWLATQTGILSAPNVVLTGTSAGGIGTFHNIDWFSGKLASLAQAKSLAAPKVVGMPIAGVFFPKNYPVLYEVFDAVGGVGLGGDSLAYDQIASDYVDLLEEPYLHESCTQAVTAADKDVGRCFDISFMMAQVETPIFIVSNRFDSMQIETFGLCPPEECSPTSPAGSSGAKFLSFYGDRISETVAEMTANRPTTGFFIPACFDHDANFAKYFTDQAKAINGMTLRSAFENWHAGILASGVSGTTPAPVSLVEPLCSNGPCASGSQKWLPQLPSRRLLMV